MSLTDEGYRRRMWERWPSLEVLLRNMRLARHWEGSTSASDTLFEQVQRALKLFALVQSIDHAVRERVCHLHTEAQTQRASGRASAADQCEQERSELLRELRELAELHHFIAVRFDEQSEDLMRLVGDA